MSEPGAKRARSDEPADPSNPHGESMDETAVVRPVKAYKNQNFMMSRAARPLRFLAEHEETLQRLSANGVKDFVMFFSSARGRSTAQHEAQSKAAAEIMASSTASEAEKTKARSSHERLQKTAWMCPMYDKVRNLSAALTKWSMATFPNENCKRFVVCTGGGPGLMEAANRGAFEVAKERSCGMGISLPFEPGLNPFVTKELGFEYHYFFMRKFMMVSHCRALVSCPGGVGTCDELFEILTLVQTGKHPRIPIVLFGKDYWEKAINFQAMADAGVINIADLKDVLVTDDSDAAFKHITAGLAQFFDDVPS